MAATPVVTAAAVPPRSLAGQRRIYDFQYSSRTVSELSALGGKASAIPAATRSFQTRVAGTLVITVLETAENGAMVDVDWRVISSRASRGASDGGEPPAVTISAGGQPALADAARVASALSRGAVARLRADGRVVSVWVEAGTALLPHSFLRSLMAATQFVVPPQPAGNRESLEWEVEEDDPNGVYLARYHPTPGLGDRFVVRKTKVAYRFPPPELGGVQGELPRRIKPSGELGAVFDRVKGRLVSLSGSERQQVEVVGRPVSDTAITLSLRLQGQDRLGGGALAALRRESAARRRATEGVALSWRIPEEIVAAASYRRELGGATFETLLRELGNAQSGAAPGGRVEIAGLERKWKALLWLNPEARRRAAELLAETPTESPTMSVLVGALSGAGHGEAQDVLVDLLRRRRNERGALDLLLPALATVAVPTAGAEAVVREIAFNTAQRDEAYAAQLALGVMARRLRRRDPARSTKIVDALVAHFGPAPERPQARELLEVLGNAGSSRALPLVRSFLAHSAIEVRAAAAGALRFVEGAEAESLLVAALAKDPDAAVRVAAARALAFRPPTDRTFRAQRKAFETDSNESLRLVLLENLWWAQEQFPEARTLLEEVARNADSPELRKKAARLLTRDR